jgi:DNA-3-methyladenine glycosylase
VKRLELDFFRRDSLEVARELLGKRLVRRLGRERRVGRIVEVEAYKGVGDLASHARRGPTPRTTIMFGQPGVAYVYLVYGMHHCMNVVAHPDGVAGAVLVRALAPVSDLPATNGPGKLAKALGIDRTLNGADLVAGRELWLEDDGCAPGRVVATPRIGVDYAGPEWAGKPWRLFVAGDPCVSGPKALRS